jgi:hypothetical protein
VVCAWKPNACSFPFALGFSNVCFFSSHTMLEPWFQNAWEPWKLTKVGKATNGPHLVHWCQWEWVFLHYHLFMSP